MMIRMAWLFFLAFLVSVFLGLGSAKARDSGPLIWLSGQDAGVSSLSGEVEVLEDPEGVLNLESVQASSLQSWHRGGARTLEVAFSQSVWWIRVKFKNEGSDTERRVIEFRSPRIDFLDVFYLEDGLAAHRYSVGDQRPVASRPIQSRNFAFPVDVAPAHELTVVFRIALKDGVFDVVPLLLWKVPEFWGQQGGEQILLGLYLGAILALSAYHLLLFLSSRDRQFLRYALFLAALALWYVGYAGYGYLYLWKEFPWINNLLGFVVPSLIFLLSTAFVSNFLETRQRTPRIHIGIVAVTLLLLVPSAMMLMDMAGFKIRMDWGLHLRNTLMHALGGLYLLAGVLVYRQGHKPAIFFLTAWLCLVIGVWVYLLSTFSIDWIPVNLWTENAIAIGSALEFQLLALGLGYRYRLLRDQAANMEQERFRQELRAKVMDAMSHEIRTPLAVIQAATENLAESLAKDDERSRRRCEKILRATRRMSGFVHDHLGDFESSMKEVGVVLKYCDPRELLREVLSSCRLNEANHRLVLELSDLPEFLLCDRRLMTLSLRNLADNAVNYSPPNSTVTFRGGADGGGVWFTIENEAPKMSSGRLTKCFEPGFRASHQPPGTGHGLTLARSMIEQQGGSLTGQMLAGGLCSFRVYLPFKA